MASNISDDRLHTAVHDVRRFNRLYTAQIGLLEQGLLDSAFSLTEVRVLYELAHRDGPTATELRHELVLNAGYLSRILARFARRGLIRKRPSELDGRRSILRLTRKGRTVFDGLDERANAQIRTMLDACSPADQRRLLAAMHTIERVLGPPAPRTPPFVLRPPRVGDMGWIVHRHGVLYAQEYGWDAEFEALVASIVSGFIEHFDPERERCWIAETQGDIAGSVVLVRKTEDIAQLRLLLVEPSARGLGIGNHLVDECTRFARQVGYQTITLWTNSVLVAARRIYARAGYRRVHEEPHHSYGHDLVGQTWELQL